LINGDIVSVELTSNATCTRPATVQSESIYMTVGYLSPGSTLASITISGNTVLNSGESVALTSQVFDAGSNATYQWQDSTATHSWRDISGATSSSINYSPQQTGNKIRCNLNTNSACAPQSTVLSQSLVFTVNTPTAVRPEPAGNSGIVYYPNPASTILIIDSIRLTDHWATLEILSIDGKKTHSQMSIMNKSRVDLYVGDLTQGYYLIQLRKKSGEISYLKFIKI